MRSVTSRHPLIMPEMSKNSASSLHLPRVPSEKRPQKNDNGLHIVAMHTITVITRLVVMNIKM